MKKKPDFWDSRFTRVLEFIFDVVLIFGLLVLGLIIDHYISTGTIVSLGWLYRTNSITIYIPIVYTIVYIIFIRAYNISVTRKKYLNILPSLVLSSFFTNLSLVVVIIVQSVNNHIYFLGNAVSVAIIFALQVLFMSLYKYLMSKLFNKYNKRIVLVYGPENRMETFLMEFFLDKSHYNEIKYFVYFNPEEVLNDTIKECINEVDDVYIAAGVSSEAKNIIVNYILQKTYKNLYIVPRTYEIGIQKSAFDCLDDTLLFRQKTMHLSLEQRIIKRLFDVFFSVIILVLTFVPMLFVALIIKLQDRGPVFYKQTRICRNNKEFKIYKFRSMKVASDEKKLAERNDSRITKFGKFLRASRIDELPQFINVLKGDMSIVGPRPLLPNIIEEAIKLNPEFANRANVKPGITGLSHVYGRYDTPDLERLRFDLMYVRKYSLLLDLSIMLLTVKVMMSKTAGLGLYADKSFKEILETKNIELIEMPFGGEFRYKN